MHRSQCLTPAELTAFNLGELPETVLDEIAEHLEHCPRCEGAAQSLDGVSDPLIDGIRGSAGADTVLVERSPVRVGDYEILGELGRGGMGVVYRARHLRLGRIAALKMLLGGEFSDPQERARFQTEAEAVARLQHPNIVQVYEAGQHAVEDGAARPYFTLEYVAGGSLAERLSGRPQQPLQAAAWLEPLARAVDYAHTQGIIHRDLKPSNVLLTAEGQPKLCDFGVAKILTGSDLKTRSGMLIGTAEYMAPEQAVGHTDVGPAADVYALGALLYTLLVGRPPFQAANPLETLAQVAHQEPVSPRRLQPAVPHDLETICLKCLRKEPAKRYASAAALADDLRRFQDGKPIQARPVGSLEWLSKWARRQPALALSLAAVVLVTAVGFVLVALGWHEAHDRAAAEGRARKDEAQARADADKAANEARVAQRTAERLLASDLLARATTLCERGEVPLGMLAFARGLEVAVRAEAPRLEHVARRNLALWRRHLIRPRGAFVTADDHLQVLDVALSPDGRQVATANTDKTARLWDVATGQPVGAPLLHRGAVLTVAFSRDSKLLLTGAVLENNRGEVRLWDAATGTPLSAQPLEHATRVTSVVFSNDGKRFLTVSLRAARLWDTHTRQQLGQPFRHATPEPTVLAGALSRDGKYVLTGGLDHTARLWDAATGKEVAVLAHRGPVAAVAFSPDSKTALTGSQDQTARLWDATTGESIGLTLRHRGPVLAVAFSRDSLQVATGSLVAELVPASGKRGSFDSEARVWEAKTGKPVSRPLPHPDAVLKVALSPDGLLLTGARDGCARVFDIASGQLIGQPLLHEGTVQALALSEDGRTALTGPAGGGQFQTARLWGLPAGLRAGVVLPAAGVQIWGMQFKEDGRTLATRSPDGVVRLWDRSTRQCLAEPLQHRGQWVVALAVSADQHKLVAAWSDKNGHKAVLWDQAAGKGIHTWPHDEEIKVVAFSPDDRTVLTATGKGTIHFWDAGEGKAVARPVIQPDGILTAAFAPDGEQVVTVGWNGQVRRWAWKTGQLLATATMSARPGIAAIAPDARVVLTAQWGPHAQLWVAADGTPQGPPLSHRVVPIAAVALSRDSSTALTGARDGTVRLWDVATGQLLGPPLTHASAILAVAFAPNGRVVATSEEAGPMRFWNLPDPVRGDAECVRLWVELLTAMAYDAHGVPRELDGPALAQRRQRLEQLGGLPVSD